MRSNHCNQDSFEAKNYTTSKYRYSHMHSLGFLLKYFKIQKIGNNLKKNDTVEN
jgi:hypothetical protein